MHRTFFIKGHIEILAGDVSRLSGSGSTRQYTVQIHITCHVAIQKIEHLFYIRDAGFSMADFKCIRPRVIREDSIHRQDDFAVDFVGFIRFPAVKVMNIFRCLRVPAMLDRKTLEQFEDGILDAL